MDPFHDQDVIGPEPHAVAGKRAAALLEVVFRNLDLFAGQQLVQLQVEEIQIHGVEALEVPFPVLVQRGLVPVDKVVVQFDDLRFQAEHPALEGDPQRGRGLSAGGRSCDHDDPALSASVVDFVGDGRVFPAVERLGDVDDVDSLASLDGLVEFADAMDPDDAAPVGIFGQGGGDLGLTAHRHDLAEVVEDRRLEAETVAESVQVKGLQIARRRDQRTVEGVRQAIQRINVGDKLSETAEQFRLVPLMLVLIDADGIFGRDLGFAERKIRGDDFLHPGFQPVDLLVFQEIDRAVPVFPPDGFLQLAIQAAREGVVNHEDLVRKQFPDGFLQDEAEGTDVAAPAVRMVVADEFNLVRHDHRITKFLEFVVHESGQDRIVRPSLGILHFRAPFL